LNDLVTLVLLTFIFLTVLDNRFKSKSGGDIFGAPHPLRDSPSILKMSDRDISLGWRPSYPTGSGVPVTYTLEGSKEPGDDWKPYASRVRNNSCDIRNLEPRQDYKFRVRVENKYGLSSPSPHVTAYRSKLFPSEPPKPKEYEIERPPTEKIGKYIL